MILFDDETFNYYAKFVKKLKRKTSVIVKSLRYLTPEDDIDNSICIFSLKRKFYDLDAFEFLRSQYNKNLKIVLTLKKDAYGKLEDSSCASHWTHALSGSYSCNYEIIAEVENDDIDVLEKLIDIHHHPNKVKAKREVSIYTDGACSGNPGKGGWAAILVNGNKEKEISGSEPDTTNNRMELLAAVKGLEAIKIASCKITLYSDSAYLVNAFNLKWIDQWKNNNWKNSEKVIVKNIDLWQRLDTLTQFHDVTFVKVKGHADNEYNNRCDKLAVKKTK